MSRASDTSSAGRLVVRMDRNSPERRVITVITVIRVNNVIRTIRTVNLVA